MEMANGCDRRQVRLEREWAKLGRSRQGLKERQSDCTRRCAKACKSARETRCAPFWASLGFSSSPHLTWALQDLASTKASDLQLRGLERIFETSRMFTLEAKELT